jgi:very-short-patch-repair endonuclease
LTILKTKFAGQAARRLRATMTDAEAKLWYHLRNRQLLGLKFVRQQPVGPYIADFACREADLIIELDGGQHGEPDSIAYDERRTTVLAEHGCDVIRFWNSDVFENIDGVLETIAAKLQAPSPGRRYAPSDLSPKGEVSRGRGR